MLDITDFAIIVLFMEITTNLFDQSCNYDDQEQDFLSCRIGRLNLGVIRPKCLTTIISQQSKPFKQIAYNLNEERDITNSEADSKRCLRITSAPIFRQQVSIKNARFYQIIENAKSKQPTIKRMNVTSLNTFSGQGILILENGRKYEGEWIDGILFEDAKITYQNGEIYFGSIHLFQKHGKGYLYFPTGDKYVGYFSYGKFHGQGTMYNKQGGVEYSGQWYQGSMLNEIDETQSTQF